MIFFKTVKDLETDWLKSTTKKGKGWKFINVEILKKEAIKIHKRLEKVPYGKNFCLICGKENKGQYCPKHDRTLHSETGDISAIQTFLEWWLNITEEDLMTNEEINAREHGEKGNN